MICDECLNYGAYRFFTEATEYYHERFANDFCTENSPDLINCDFIYVA